MVRYRYVLASGSPRRRELLTGLGLEYELRLMDGIDESYPATLRGEEIPIAISRKKSEAYLATLAEDELLITADTIVYLDGRVIGKPRSEEEACEMLRALSGRTHEVMTGVTLATKRRSHSFGCTSRVTFAPLAEEDIRHYVSTFHPLDKAGAYGIQEWIGYIGVTSIEGSYYNVMGLPVQRLYTELKRFMEND
ncbi:MAG: Maf-like protein [Prevotellaceae bacterium]|nr:Maf-like protein [Prevotellaceae bacterium]